MLILFDDIDRYDISADHLFSFRKDQLLYCIVNLVEIDVMVYECYTIYHQLLFSQMASDLVSRQ